MSSVVSFSYCNGVSLILTIFILGISLNVPSIYASLSAAQHPTILNTDSNVAFKQVDGVGNGVYFSISDFEGTVKLASQSICPDTTSSSCVNVSKFELASVGGTDVYIAKYNMANNLIWAMKGGGPGDDHIQTMAIDNVINGMRVASSTEASIYVAGTAQGHAGFGSYVVDTITANKLNQVLFLARYNSSNGDINYARAIATCAADASYQSLNKLDPKNPWIDTYGNCNLFGSSVDGNKSIVMVGKFFGTLILPTKLFYTFVPEVHIDANKKAVAGIVDDVITTAIGEPTHSQFFDFPLQPFSLELESMETSWSARCKIRDYLKNEISIRNINLFWKTTIPPKSSKQKAMVIKTIVNDAMLMSDALKVGNMTVEICTTKRFEDARLFRSGLCGVKCATVVTGSQICPKNITDVSMCPKTCSRNSDCITNSYCENPNVGVCVTSRKFCSNATFESASMELRSGKKCRTRSGTGRVCSNDPFLIKFDKNGLFEWGESISNIFSKRSKWESWRLPELQFWSLQSQSFLSNDSEANEGTIADNWPTASSTGVDQNLYKVIGS